MTRPTLDQALQVAQDVDHDGLWMREGAPAELTPETVEWLATLALHHPQVSAAVAAALPSSRWLMPWSTAAWPHERVGAHGGVVAQVQPNGDRWEWRVGDMGGWHHALTADAARAEVDERLLAGGLRLLGAVYRRAGEP